MGLIIKNMKEHDLRATAKVNAEYITPQPLREFLASKIEKDNITILEPAIGSGQLLFELKDKIKFIDGFDISPHSAEMVKKNFEDKVNVFNQDFICSEIDKVYDFAIANYPFSLKFTQEQKECVANDKFLKQFFVKKDAKKTDYLFEVEQKVKPDQVSGVLDYMFILKSFHFANEGLFFCFPGIGYRSQEEKFRKYLIENKFIKEVGLLDNCKFDHTSISILFLHLTKEPNEETKCFRFDFETQEKLEEVANFENNKFTFPQKEIAEEDYGDPIELEKEARQSLIDAVKKSILCSAEIYKIDKDLHNNLPSVEEFKIDLINAIINPEN